MARVGDDAVGSLVRDVAALISLSDLREAVRRNGGSYALEALDPMPPGKFWWQDYGRGGPVVGTAAGANPRPFSFLRGNSTESGGGAR